MLETFNEFVLKHQQTAICLFHHWKNEADATVQSCYNYEKDMLEPAQAGGGTIPGGGGGYLA